MNVHTLFRDLSESNSTKIVLLAANGLGGLALEAGGLKPHQQIRTGRAGEREARVPRQQE
jgi:hypothetical protein